MNARYEGYIEKAMHILMVLLVFSSGLYFFSFITADPDLWGHILFGRDTFFSKDILWTDPYSYTAYGMVWINHEWVSEILMWITFNSFGATGLLIGKTLIGFTIILILLFICIKRKSKPIVYCLVVVTAVSVMSPGFMTRPHLMTFLFASLFFLVIHFFLERRVNILWALPLIMILWVNTHGGFVIGAGILPVIVILEYISCHLQSKDKSHLKRLFLWMIITEISILVNPYGLKLPAFIYTIFSQPGGISEWDGVMLIDLSYMRFKILTLLFIISVFINRNKNRFWEIGIITVAMVFAYLHQRHTPIFAIFVAPFIAEKLSDIKEDMMVNRKVFTCVSHIIISMLLLMIIGYQIYSTVSKYIKTEFNIIVDPNIYPIRAVQFLKENSIKGNVLVPFDWGEYVIWKLYPDNRVSIDGRFTTVYPEEVIIDHFEGAKSQKSWEDLLNKYPTDIILAKRDLFSQSMITKPSSKWVYIYSDKISIVFLKNNKSMKDVISGIKAKKLVYPNDNLSIYFP